MSMKELDPIDFDNYDDGGPKDYAPPAEGKYFAQAPIITDESFSKTQEGYGKVEISPIKILDPAANGYEVKFTRLSFKKYAKREGSPAIDFLRACGIVARPKTNDELKQLLKSASGRKFQFGLQWEAYNKDSKESIKGQANFPPDPQDATKRLPYVVDPHDNSKRWWANGTVHFFVSALGKQ
jgi:hypothetical protein